MKHGEIFQGDFLEWFQARANAYHNSIDLVLTDPPYNQGVSYPGYDDNLSPELFKLKLKQWARAIGHLLRPGGAAFVFMSDEYVANLKLELDASGLVMRNWLIWHYTFGVHQKGKFNRSKAHVLYYVKPGGEPTFNLDAIRVPSHRQVKYNDKRANPQGATPHDVWALLPDVEEKKYRAECDVWCLSRVCGTFGERAGAPTQLPEAVVQRIIVAASKPGDIVFDPFLGSGTTLAVAQRFMRVAFGCEISERSAMIAKERFKKEKTSPRSAPSEPVQDAAGR